MKTASSIALALGALLVVAAPRVAQAETDCLSCHGDKSLQDASGKSVGVDAGTFGISLHGSLKCGDCHTTIKDYPHPDQVTPVKCESCHTGEAQGLVGSVHANRAEHPCTSCHGDAHAIFPKSDPRSAVYPLNIPRTCGNCHGNDALAKKHGLPNVYPMYLDSIHGFALSKEGLLVAANCQSCHGSHHILSHNNPQSPTYKANVPKTCGTCHAGITDNYVGGVHGKAVASGNLNAPVCSDCHTAHAILQPTEATFRMQSTPICGSCHKDKLSTYRDTFHSQLGSLGGYVETARCWDCHGAHDVLPASDPRSPIAPANLVATCGKCHAGANASFVQYQPHANAHNRKLNPALFYIRLFMNLLLAGVLAFFAIHTILWLVRSRYHQVKTRSAKGGNNG
ncbi:MAG: cytochrome c3 family protein [Terracidiphilus sp.]|jgi:predicted CXXCH cytochrome family protein